MAGISLRQVTKTYGTLRVLNGIDLDIADGEYLTLVGPSGCGKSTTLRIIAGLETQTTGDVEIDGRVVNEVRPSRRDLAMVFQSYALYPHLTVRQNLVTPLQLRDMNFWQRIPLLGYLAPGRRAKMSKIEDDMRKAAEILKIEPLLHRKPGQLSGGQRQRVALGRAMVRNPAAFLMDEPLSNLDAALRVHMRAELSELHRELGATFVYVTHDQAEALTMSDRMAVMMDGDILQLGPPDEVYEDPRDIRVAEFIGSPKMNILPGQGDSAGRITALGVAVQEALEVPSEGPLSVGFRPEHLHIQAEDTGACLSGRLTYKENLGSDVFLHLAVETAGSSRALAMAFAVTRRGGITVTAGMPGPEAQVTLSHLCIAAEERTLKGSYMGSCVPKRDIPRFLALFRDGKLPVDRLLSRTIGFDDLNAALDRLNDAATVREVLIP